MTSRKITLPAMMLALGVAMMSVAVMAETPPEIKAIEARAAAYARLTPAERSDMWRRTMRAAAEFELIPPHVQTEIPARYTHAKLDYAMNCGVARTPKGRLWAVWVGGEDGAKSFVVGCWSDDGGRTWTDTRLVVDSHRTFSDWDLMRVNICHQIANVWCSPDGRLRFFVYQSAGIFSGRGGTWEFVCDNPDDAQPRWSAPRYMFPGAFHNKPIVMRDGTWLYFNDFEPYGRENFPELEPFMGCGVYATRDGGVLERRGFTRPEGTWHWAEHMALERNDGTLWMMLRTGKGLMESFSKDKGFTWTSPAPPRLIKACISRFSFMRLASGRFLFVKNGTAVNVAPASREKLSAYISEDEGETWKGPLVLDDRNDVSYPDAFQFPDGAIGLTYDRNRSSDAEILFARFTEEDVLAGEIRSKGSFLRSVVVSARLAREKAGRVTK